MGHENDDTSHPHHFMSNSTISSLCPLLDMAADDSLRVSRNHLLCNFSV